MANQEHVHLRPPIPFQPSIAQLDQMPLLKENIVPRYLFRLYSPITVGTTSPSHLIPPSATSLDPNHYRDIFSLPETDAAWRLNHHLRWWSDHERDCNLMSWSGSLLFLLQYALYRHRSPTDGSEFSEISLLVIDTRDFPPRTFVRDTEVMTVLAPSSNEPGRNLRDLLKLRSQYRYYFGEYLSQGDLDLVDKCAETTFATLVELGLFDLVPALRDQTNWRSWANPVLEFRDTFREPASSDATHGEVRRAITMAEGAFGGQWTIPISAMLLSLKPRRANDRVITEGYKAMFSPSEFERASLSDMHTDDDRQPEVEQFHRLTVDIDSYLNRVQLEENLAETFGTLELKD